MPFDQKKGREHWASDDEAERCFQCHRRFRLTLRRHHCRRCGGVFCHQCSGFAAQVTAPSRVGEEGYVEKTKRVCGTCFALVGDERRQVAREAAAAQRATAYALYHPPPERLGSASSVASPKTPGDPPESPESPLKQKRCNGKIQWLQGSELGRGSFGTVFMAMNSSSGQLLAVKQMSRPKGSAAALEELSTEVSVMRRVRHINVVAYYGTELTQKHLNILMEFVPGGSLRGLLERFGAFSEPVVAVYGRQLLEGIGHLHGLGIVHRDIKASNVLVNDAGVIKLSDFGTSLVDQFGGEGSSDPQSPPQPPAAGPGQLVGTVLWLSPEVVRGGLHSWRSDVWAFGCTLLEMASAWLPWHPNKFSNHLEVLLHIGRSETPPARPETLGPSLQEVLQLCFQIDYEARRPCAALRALPFFEEQEAGGEAAAEGYDDDHALVESINVGTCTVSTRDREDHLDFLRTCTTRFSETWNSCISPPPGDGPPPDPASQSASGASGSMPVVDLIGGPAGATAGSGPHTATSGSTATCGSGTTTGSVATMGPGDLPPPPTSPVPLADRSGHGAFTNSGTIKDEHCSIGRQASTCSRLSV
eukprot:Hpha_TRINITY_DN18328_c0_g1::TRINITY_DN18328_c0_g1_i1::g.158182::m.158182